MVNKIKTKKVSLTPTVDEVKIEDNTITIAISLITRNTTMPIVKTEYDYVVEEMTEYIEEFGRKYHEELLDIIQSPAFKEEEKREIKTFLSKPNSYLEVVKFWNSLPKYLTD